MAIFNPDTKVHSRAWAERLIEPGTGNFHSVVYDIASDAQLGIV